MTLTAVRHPDLDGVLAILARSAPAAAGRAEAVLEQMLADVRYSPIPEHAWHASALTGDGFPVELTFTSLPGTLGYTVAPWPEVAQGRRLALAADLIARIGGHELNAPERESLAGLQAGGRLRYGAWIGARHATDPSGDRLKLYAEVGSETAGTGERGAQRLEDRRVHLRMYGVEPATGRRERYFRVPRMMPHHVRVLMGEAGLGARADELLALIAAAAGRPIVDGLPGGSVGFSLARSPSQSVVLTVYLFARSLWGGDGRIRRGLLALGRGRGWSLGAYEEVSAPLATRDVHQTFHGLVGFSVAAERPVAMAIGLRPPPLGRGA